MQIEVKEVPTSFKMNETGLFKCDHNRAIVEKPCCMGEDCACMGLCSVYCPDCDDKLNSEEICLILGGLDG